MRSFPLVDRRLELGERCLYLCTVVGNPMRVLRQIVNARVRHHPEQFMLEQIRKLHRIGTIAIALLFAIFLLEEAEVLLHVLGHVAQMLDGMLGALDQFTEV